MHRDNRDHHTCHLTGNIDLVKDMSSKVEGNIERCKGITNTTSKSSKISLIYRRIDRIHRVERWLPMPLETVFQKSVACHVLKKIAMSRFKGRKYLVHLAAQGFLSARFHQPSIDDATMVDLMTICLYLVP